MLLMGTVSWGWASPGLARATTTTTTLPAPTTTLPAPTTTTTLAAPTTTTTLPTPTTTTTLGTPSTTTTVAPTTTTTLGTPSTTTTLGAPSTTTTVAGPSTTTTVAGPSTTTTAGASTTTTLPGVSTTTTTVGVSSTTILPSTTVPGSTSSTTTLPPVSYLAITDAPDSVMHGDVIVYDLYYGNADEVDHTNVVLTATYDATNTTFKNATPAPDATPGHNQWSIGTVAAGTTARVRVRLDVKPAVADGTVTTISASIDSDQDDPVVDTESTLVSAGAASEAHVTVSVEQDPSIVRPGDQVRYTVTYGNDGTGAAQSAELSWQATEGLTLAGVPSSASSASPTSVVFPLGDLPPGASGSAIFFANVAGDVDVGSVRKSRLTLHSTPTGAIPQTAGWYGDAPSATRAESDGLRCEMLLRNRFAGAAIPGSTLRERLSFFDTCFDIHSASVDLELPDGVDFVSLGGSGTATLNGRTVTISYGDVPHGQVPLSTLVLKVASDVAEGTNLQAVALLSDEDGRMVSSTAEATVRAASTVAREPSVSVSGSRKSAQGRPASYAVRYRNAAPGSRLVWTLADGISATLATPAPSSVSGNILTWENVPATGAVKIRGVVSLPEPAPLLASLVSRASLANPAAGTSVSSDFETVATSVAGGSTSTSANPTITATGVRFGSANSEVQLDVRFRGAPEGSVLRVELPGLLRPETAVPAAASISGGAVSWAPSKGTSGAAKLRLLIDPSTPRGSTLTATATVTGAGGKTASATYSILVR